MLDGGSVEFLGDTREHLFARRAIVAEDPDLDESVGEQVDVDFVQDRGRQAVVADHHDRIEMVGLRAERTPLVGCQIGRFHR